MGEGMKKEKVEVILNTFCVCTGFPTRIFNKPHSQGIRDLGQENFSFKVLVELLLFSAELEESRKSSSVPNPFGTRKGQ